MKRLAAALLITAATLGGLGGSAHAATISQILVGSATLADGTRVTVSATRGGGTARGTFTVRGPAGGAAQGNVICLISTTYGTALVATVTRSAVAGFAPGSLFGGVFLTSNRRVDVVFGGQVAFYIPNGDGTCMAPVGTLGFGGAVSAGTILALP